MPNTRHAAVRAILIAGGAAATLDILSAFALSGTPVRVLHAIASGVLGRAAFEGGAGIALLGLALHYLILLVAAALYFAAQARRPALALHPLRFGALYGLAVWAFMHGVVLPLSAIPFAMPYRPAGVALQLAIHVLLVGWPIALALRHVAPSSRREPGLPRAVASIG
jgi:hypothetical protein